MLIYNRTPPRGGNLKSLPNSGNDNTNNGLKNQMRPIISKTIPWVHTSKNRLAGRGCRCLYSQYRQ